MVDEVLEKAREEIKRRGYDIREDLPFNTLEEWAKRYGIIAENARSHFAGSYYQEAYKSTHGLDMPEYEHQSEKYKKLNAQNGTSGVSRVTQNKANAVMQAAAKEDGLLYGLFGERSLLRFGNKGAVSEILENLVVPLAFLRSRDSAKDLNDAYIDAYKRGVEAQRRAEEEGYQPNENDYYAIDEAKQWDYLAHLVEEGDEDNARLLAIQLLDLYYQRVVKSENAETSDFGMFLKNEYAAVQGVPTKVPRSQRHAEKARRSSRNTQSASPKSGRPMQRPKKAKRPLNGGRMYGQARGRALQIIFPLVRRARSLTRANGYRARYSLLPLAAARIRKRSETALIRSKRMLMALQ